MIKLRSILVRLLLGNDVAELLQGYRPPRGKHNSLITGSPTSWAWGKGDHGLELVGLGDDDHTQYLNNARHNVVARHPLSVLDPAVCSETEADNKIAELFVVATGDAGMLLIKSAQPGTLADFQAATLSGTMSQQAELIDGDTGTMCYKNTVGGYTELNLNKLVKIDQWRMFGNPTQNEDGVWKLSYFGKDEAWHDWVTGIPTRTASWSDMSVETEVTCSKVRLTITTLDSSGTSRTNELEVYHS